jgi:hypothetical protein
MKEGEDKLKNYLETKLKKVNGWIVMSPFGGRDFINGDWQLQAAAAAHDHRQDLEGDPGRGHPVSLIDPKVAHRPLVAGAENQART